MSSWAAKLGRQSYADAGQAMRLAIERANAADLSRQDFKVFTAVLSYTGTWSKFADNVYLADLAKIVFALEHVERWHIDKVGRSLKNLSEAGVIEREPPRRGPSGWSFGPSYLIGIAPDSGRIGDDEEHVDEDVNPPDSGRNEPNLNPPDSSGESARSRKSIRPGSGDPPRSSSEKGSEEEEANPADSGRNESRRIQARSLLVKHKAKNNDLVDEVVAYLEQYSDEAFRAIVKKKATYVWPSEVKKALEAAERTVPRDRVMRALAGMNCDTCHGSTRILPDGSNEAIPCPDCSGSVIDVA